jgi:uncharacterized protein
MAKEKSVKLDQTIKTYSILTTEPAPLGLIGLATAALVIGSSYLELTSHTDKSLMIPWILFFGATAQLIAGIMEFKRNNIFGSTVFTTYAMAMYAIATTLLISIFGGVAFDITHYGYGLIAVLFFSFVATIASLMTNKVFIGILIAVDIAVVGLIPHYLAGSSAFIGGLFLMVTSALSFYAAAAILINTMAGKTVLSLGSPIWKP